MTKKPHRLHIVVSDELFDELRDTIQWGLRQHLVAAVLKLLIDAVKQDGMMVVGAILSGEYKLVRAEKPIVMRHTNIDTRGPNER